MMPTVRIFCIGVNQNTAPVNVREGLTCSALDLQDYIKDRCGDSGEWLWLATCNRVELYVAVVDDGIDAHSKLRHLFEELFASHQELTEDQVYFHQGRAATNHLMRVTAGLDSMILGEPQILGQVKAAYEDAIQAGSAGPAIKAVFDAAIAAGKRVRSETEISSNPASIPSVAINQAQSLLGDLSEKSILLIGAGAMAHVAIKALQARGIRRIAVANRTQERAARLVEPWDGAAYGLDDLPQALANADLVFSATYAHQPIIDQALLASAQERRNFAPLLLFDLAVPRDIEPQVSRIPGVTLVNVDRLQAELDESLNRRRLAIPIAEAIIAAEHQRLDARLGEVAIRPVIAGLRQKAERIRRRELARTLRHLGPVDDETLAHINHLSRALVNQLLHEPTTRLRQSASNGHREEMATAVCDLFDLPLGEEESRP